MTEMQAERVIAELNCIRVDITSICDSIHRMSILSDYILNELKTRKEKEAKSPSKELK